MPARADLDPTELPGGLWPHLVLMDVVRDGGRVRRRYRLVGTAFERQIGRNVTGTFTDEALASLGAYARYLGSIFDEVTASGVPSYVENLFVHANQKLTTLTR